MKPYIILNCAASADGKIALPNRQKIELSDESDFERVHDLRSECDAIIVGIETVIEDNPSLTINQNYSAGRNPLRVILDTNYRTPLNSKITDGNSRTLIAIGDKTPDKEIPNVEIIRCGNNEINLQKLVHLLYKRGIKKILVEGGETVLWSFLEKQLFDELNIFISNVIVGGENTPTIAGGSGFENQKELLKLKIKDVTKSESGILIKYSKSKN